MGCPVNLKCKSGDTFHGIFATFSPEVIQNKNLIQVEILIFF